jgi:hypothetical protein
MVYHSVYYTVYVSNCTVEVDVYHSVYYTVCVSNCTVEVDGLSQCLLHYMYHYYI